MKRIAVILVVLLVTLFLFVGVTSSTPYDAWYDFDDDGDIDIYDIVDIAGRYGTTGTPLNKTEMLLELAARIDALNATLMALVENHTCGTLNIVSDSFTGTTDGADGTLIVSFPASSFAQAPEILYCRVVLKQASGAFARGTVVYANILSVTKDSFEIEVVEERGSYTTVNGIDVDVVYLAIGTENASITQTGVVEGGKYDGEVQLSMVQTDPGAEFVINFSRPFTTIEAPELVATVVIKSAGDGLVEGAAIRVEEDIKGIAGSWYGFDLTVSKYGGGSLSNGAKVFVTWIAIGRAPEQGASPKECVVVTGSKPYNDPMIYASGTGFIINVSDSIPSGFTLVSAFATGRKTDLGGTTLDEPPLNLLPRVSGTNIEIRVWDAGGVEYGNWSNERAHIDYTLFITK